MMTSHAKQGIQAEHQVESWMVELILPGMFTVILLGCLAHLGFCVMQEYAQARQTTDYAISAFAN